MPRWGGPDGLRSRAVHSLVRGVLRPIAAGGRKARPPLPSGRRMLLLHVDGVGRSQLYSALREGYAPNVAQLLDSGRYLVSSCRAGVPTSTPSFQAGLLYGCEADIPGYVWYDKRRRRAMRMDCYEDARHVERDLARRGDPLLRSGSVYCSIFSGGAPRRWALSGIFEKLTAADLGWERGASIVSLARDLAAAALVHTATAGRISGALLLDVASGIVETARWAATVGSLQHESQFLFHRVLTECLFSEFAANATVIDVARGIPIVYACFIGYDEYAHRRGPYSHMVMLKLFELDRALGRIFAAVDAVAELGYEVYLFSDHGQAATRPAEQIVGESLGEHLLSDTPSRGEHVRPVAFGGAGGGNAAATAAQARWLRALSRSLPGALGKLALGWARHEAKALDAAQPPRVRADGPLLVVPAGDIAHVYSTEVAESCLEADIRARHPGLLDRCANSPIVGVALVRTARGPVALRNGRRFELERASDAAEVSRLIGHPLAATYCKDLIGLRSAGDVVLVGAGGGQTVAYPWEFGSHGGLAAEEVETFVVHPAALGENAFADVVRPRDLHSFFRARSLPARWHGEERRAVAR
ncbi:MAG TPA: alkaline phosphatase family protein [Myxococcales bacterium]|nr:alkaline phosphatase family protein [Myxococcales bacterium]